jgi:hypothetical protein
MFAWCPADMPGIPRELAEHEFMIFSQCEAHQIVNASLQSREVPVNGGRNKLTTRSKIHQGDKRGNMAITASHGGEERHQDQQDVHRLHHAQQALPKRLISTPSN